MSIHELNQARLDLLMDTRGSDDQQDFLYRDAMLLLKGGRADLISDDHLQAVHATQQDWLARTAKMYEPITTQPTPPPF